MDHGVTMMMKVRETAERDLTKLAFISALTVSLMGLLAACVPSSTGKAVHRAVLPRRDIDKVDLELYSYQLLSSD